MNKAICILTFLLACVHLAKGQEIPVADNYSIVDTATGDLDKDSIKELVVAYNMGPNSDVEPVSRELIIYKLRNNKWVEWKKSLEALYGSLGGGMSGDPFEDMEIKNGLLLISQNGGSSWKWGFTDKYRFQNGDFYLVGYTSHDGKPCEHWREVDFNLSTGKLIVTKEYEECETEQKIYKRENETFFEKGLKITLQHRQEKKINITTPKYKHEINIAIGKE